MLTAVFFVVCSLVVVVLILYLFFWNRVIGYGLSLLVRVSLWNQGSQSLWIDVGSIQFSLLAGRILFKDLSYHSSNQTIRLVKGQLSWRYWIRRPTEEADLMRARSLNKLDFPLSCRIHLSVQGFEWFLYSRTAAYDNIVAQMQSEPSRSSYSDDAVNRVNGLRKDRSRSPGGVRLYPPPSLPLSALSKTPPIITRAMSWIKSQLPMYEFSDFLPVSIDVTKGAIVCGNASTPNLLVAEYTKAEGTFGVVPSRSKLDVHKHMLSVKFQDALIRYAVNDDYVAPMIATGEKIHDQAKKDRPFRQGSYVYYQAFQKLWRRINLASIPYLSSTKHQVRPNAVTLGSFRSRKQSHHSMDDATPVGADFTNLEYAIERNILEAPSLELTYYVDTVGYVPTLPSSTVSTDDPFDIGNGDVPPEWGLNLIVNDGVIRYGPWADRQRVELQRTFFPFAYRDLISTPRLKPGDKRIWPSLKVFVELRDSATWQLPFREASKNWQWDGVIDYPRPRKREAASIYLRAGENSSISYVLPMVIGPNGYESHIDVCLDAITVTSNVNDIRVLSAQTCHIRGDFPVAIKWDDRRKWTFSTSLRHPIMYSTREHINMFSDLGKDWSSGPPSDYYRFVPMAYVLELDLQKYEMNAYVNDHNIIDKPAIKEENALMIIHGAKLKARAEVDSTQFRPIFSTVPFWVDAPDLLIRFTFPRWNTHTISAHVAPQTDVGRIGDFRLDGFYRYFEEARKDNVDQLKLDVISRNVTLKCFGWVIRHFMILRENYFGSFTQFSTLNEYLDRKRQGLPVGDLVELKYRPGKNNILEVVMQVEVDHGFLILPAGLPGFERAYDPPVPVDGHAGIGIGACVLLAVPSLRVQLRTHDYFMELSFNVDPMSGVVQEDFPEEALFMNPSYRHSKEHFVIDGLDIVANRLFGPQPRTSTYVCVWEIHVGRIKSFMSTKECGVFLAAITALRSNFSDVLNAPAREHNMAIDPDVTFLKGSIDALEATWHVGNAALRFSAPNGLRIESNDLSGQYYRKVTSVRLGRSSLKMLLTSNPNHTWLEAAHADFDFCLDLYGAPVGWRTAAQAQAEFIVAQDAPTGRASSLIAAHWIARDIPVLPVRPHGMCELYLAQLQLPVVEQVNGDGHQAESRPILSHQASNQDEYSDSESDEPISGGFEAMRDAQLAKSRSGTPTFAAQLSDDGSMSSGDESDNEDLTEPDNYESDWSESNESLSKVALAALLSKYRKYTRIYVSSARWPPSNMDNTSFQLFKDHRPRSSLRDNSGNHAHVNAVSPLGFLDENSRSGTTTVRVRIDHGIQISITPLVVPAVYQFFHDIMINPLSPELHFDAMLENYSYTLTEHGPSQTRVIIDLSIPSTRVRFVHEISPGKLGQFMTPNELSNVKASSNSQLNIVALELSGLRVVAANISTSSPAPTLRATLNSACVSIHTSRRYTVDPTTTFDRVFLLSLDNCHTSLANNEAGLHLSCVCAELNQLSIANIVVCVGAIGSLVKKVLAVHKGWRNYSFARDQQMIRQVLLFSNTKPILAPLSTIQPSYLIHSGQPHRLRTDPTFKLLFHLRRSLRQLDDGERQTLAQFSPNLDATIALEDILPLFSSDYVSLAVDTDLDTVYSMPLLLQLFPPTHTQASSPTRYGNNIADTAVVSIGLLKVEFWNNDNHHASEFTLRSFSVAARRRISNLPQATNTSVGRVSESGRVIKRQFAFDVSLGELVLFIVPDLMDFAQQLLRVRLTRGPTSSPVTDSKTALSKAESRFSESILVDLVLNMEQFRLQAAAEKLIIEFQVSNTILNSSILLTPIPTSVATKTVDTSMNHSLLFAETVLMACAADTPRENDQHVLAALTVSQGKLSAVMRQESFAPLAARLLVGFDGVDLSVPRSAIRLYRFAEAWKMDYFHRIEATVLALMAEIGNRDETPVAKKSSKFPSIHVNLSLSSLRVSLQVMHGTWLSWEVNDSLLFLKSSGTAKTGYPYSFGLQVGSQVFCISSKPHWSKNVVKSKTVKIGLPMVSVTGYHDGTEVHAIGLVEFFSLTSRPSHWDTFLTVQQKFGQDFNELIAFINEKRGVVPAQKNEATSQKLKFSGFCKMKGFQFGLEGRASTLLLECENISVGVNNRMDRLWNLDVSDLALSLAPRTLGDLGTSSFDRLNRSAFVVIDFQVIAGVPRTPTEQVLDIGVTKIHAVMQPSSIGEFGDFVDHLQAEFMVRAKQRAVEVAEFKEKTRNVIRTFDTREKNPSSYPFQEWLSGHMIKFMLKNIGFAFPLALDQELKPKSRDSSAVAAFLFSIRSLVFSIQRGESGRASMKGTSFQFVSRFRQSVSTDFIGENHETHNRLLYPEVKAQVKTEQSATSRQIRFGADVDGFVLHIDSCIPDHISSLITVYRQGKERLYRLTKSIPRNAVGLDLTPRLTTSSLETQYSAIPTSNVMGSLTFESGEVRLYSSSMQTRASPSAHHYIDEALLDADITVFNMPVVAVWAEYRATPAYQKLADTQDMSSILMFKSTVYSSINTFRPAFLFFLSEFVDHVEERFLTPRIVDPDAISQSQSFVPAKGTSYMSDSVSSMQISFSLRIDRSKLELTCHPDANVIAGVHWNSGGFVFTFSPGARQVAFSGSVAGLTVGLKHGFLSEDCVRLDARNLVFTVGFTDTLEDGTNSLVRSVSAILSTEISGGVKFSRLQDILCFKAVWLDHIPVFNGRSSRLSDEVQNVDSAPPPQLLTPRTERGFRTIIMINIRHVKLDIDLGQSITSLKMDFKNADFRTKLTDTISELSLSVAESSVLAVGNLSGRGHVPDFLFQTRRKPEGVGVNMAENNRMLDLTMTSGPLDIVLESDHQLILQYHAEPLQVLIFDDWTNISQEVPESDRRLCLSFTVFGKEVVAIATVGTIPKLVSYANKFKANLEGQKEGASRESKAFRIANSPKPVNPLSEIANAMLRSARTSLRGAESSSVYVIRQQMSLHLEKLRFVIFPRTILDSEMVNFVGSRVHARLDRVVESEGQPPRRDLRLSFLSMTISKFSQVRYELSIRKDSRPENEWLPDLFKDSQEAIIFGLPSMTIRMLTDEVNDWLKTIMYDFTSRFKRRGGPKDAEDIYITLNVSLYSWLTLLRKNFAREMEQVHASAIVLGPSGTHVRRNTKPSEHVYEEPEPSVGLQVDSRSSTPPMHSIALPNTNSKKSREEGPSSSSGLKPIDNSAPQGAITPVPRRPIVYQSRSRQIERLTMRQLGEATPDVMHPFFTKKAGFSLEDSLPQYVHEYATMPTEEIMKVLLKLYSRQLGKNSS